MQGAQEFSIKEKEGPVLAERSQPLFFELIIFPFHIFFKYVSHRPLITWGFFWGGGPENLTNSYSGRVQSISYVECNFRNVSDNLVGLIPYFG